MIFHLRNHYALIFALREWEEESSAFCTTADQEQSVEAKTTTADSKKVIIRQALTAKKGQRPSTWIDFEEVREIVLGWEGYKILEIKLH